MSQDYAEAVIAAQAVEHCPLCGKVATSTARVAWAGGSTLVIGCPCVPVDRPIMFAPPTPIPPEVWAERDRLVARTRYGQSS